MCLIFKSSYIQNSRAFGAFGKLLNEKKKIKHRKFYEMIQPQNAHQFET